MHHLTREIVSVRHPSPVLVALAAGKASTQTHIPNRHRPNDPTNTHHTHALTQAIEIDPSAHTYWSNRSASYAGLQDWENAATDAAECVKVNKGFVKGASVVVWVVGGVSSRFVVAVD